MSHGRLDQAPAGRLRLDRPNRLDPIRGRRRFVAAHVRHPVPPRGGPYAKGPGDPAQLRRRYRRSPPDLDRGQLHRDHRRGNPQPRRRTQPRNRRKRQGPVRSLRRSGFGRGRDPRPSSRRRPPGLRPRGPRNDAQERDRTAGQGLRAAGRQGHRRQRQGAIPAQARRRRRSGAEAPHHRQRVHPRLRGGGGQTRRDRVPDSGHALPGRDRISHFLERQGSGQDQNAPQRGRPAGRPHLSS